MNNGLRILAFLAVTILSAQLPAQDDFSVAALRSKALQALGEGNTKDAIENADGMVRLAPRDPGTALQAADIYLRAGKVEWAVRLFDRYLKSKRQDLPQLWQRGIALYFMGEYQAAASQFEVHRTVNPNDVENAAWHFLCVAKAESPSEAKAKLLPAPGDPRPPMDEVLKMLSSGDQKIVTNKVESLPIGSKERESAQFYGDFYLGLYADATGRPDDARKFMYKAAENAPRNYMGDVARVYAKQLKEANQQ